MDIKDNHKYDNHLQDEYHTDKYTEKRHEEDLEDWYKTPIDNILDITKEHTSLDNAEHISFYKTDKYKKSNAFSVKKQEEGKAAEPKRIKSKAANIALEQKKRSNTHANA